jgi:hypothetical protein
LVAAKTGIAWIDEQYANRLAHDKQSLADKEYQRIVALDQRLRDLRICYREQIGSTSMASIARKRKLVYANCSSACVHRLIA